MRWRYPRSGETRVRTYFAWLPVSDSSTSYWLERVTVLEKFCWWGFEDSRWIVEHVYGFEPWRNGLTLQEMAVIEEQMSIEKHEQIKQQEMQRLFGPGGEL